MKTLKTFAAVLIAGAGLLGATAANAVASYTYSFQGVTFTFTGDNGSNTFSLNILGAKSASGDWTDAEYIQALGFKDLGIDFQVTGVSAAMTSPSGWDYVQAELDANACKDPTGQTGVICFEATTPLALTDNMTFNVTITGDVLDITACAAGQTTKCGPHVKLQFLDAQYNKEGSLLSRNFSGGDGPPDGDVPEPTTLALLGLGLLGLGFGARRKQM